jgi:hypothetical protein
MRRMLLMVLGLLALCSSARAGELVLFDGRKLEEVVFRARAWKLEKSWLEGSGETNEIAGASLLGEGDFVLRARIELPDKKGQRAAIVLGSSRFGIDGEEGKCFTEGPLFGDKRTLLPDAGKAWTAGKPFEVELRRSGEKLTVVFDKTLVFERAVGTQAIGGFGISPGGGKLKLWRLGIEGKLVAPPAAPAASSLQPAIDAALERGIAYLLKEQQRDGSWPCNQRGFPTGQTALCVYTLLRCGLGTDHPAVARGLEFLNQNTPEETYSAGYCLMAWEATLDPQYRPRIELVLQSLLEWQSKGHWSYPEVPNDDGFTGWKGIPGGPDLSNTQYAVLGLRAAAHAGVAVPDKVWCDVLENVLRLQEKEYNVEAPLKNGATGTGKLPIAGFSYALNGGVSASMTAAGVGVVSIARAELGPRASPKQVLDCTRAAELGINWLGSNFTLEENVGGDPRWRWYLLYGLERVGTLNEIEFLGTHDWYGEGARWLLKTQDGDGSWTDARWATDNWHTHPRQHDTCWALLFFRRASRPVVRTAGPEQFAPPKLPPDPGQQVQLRANGRTTAVMFLAGFSDAVLARWGGGALSGMRIARVEYLANDKVVESVPGNPQKGWTTEDYAVRHTFAEPGQYKVKARVWIVAPDAPSGATETATSLESKEKTITSDGTYEPWMELAAQARTRNLLLNLGVNASASSDGGAGPANFAADGFECTRWLCNEKDATPQLVVQLARPVKASSLVLGPAQNTTALKGEYDRITRISVRLNKDKEATEVPVEGDELRPIVWAFGKQVLVSRIEIKILAREKGKQAGKAGFSEVALEK